jgi:DNA polymerase-3 subunit delta'
MWEDAVGQERAIAVLERAARRPVHAYLLVGPRGSGVEDAARAFAARLIGADDDRGRDLVRRGLHPDVVEFEPAAASYRVKEDVRARILPEAMRAPVEAERKVLVLLEAERLRGNQNEAANALLKTLEEPPPRTIVVLVTSVPEDLLPTIRSRCQRIDLDPVSDELVAATLRREGVPAEKATLAATLSGGQLARARGLCGPLAALREVAGSVPRRVTGTGANAVALAEEIDRAVEAAAAQVAQRHAEELAGFDAEMERYGYSDRDAQRLRRRIDERHKREVRRARIDLLLEAVTAIETVYRDVLAAGAPPLNADRPPVVVSARSAAAALDACREAREAFVVNEKGIVRLVALVMALPPATG